VDPHRSSIEMAAGHKVIVNYRSVLLALCVCALFLLIFYQPNASIVVGKVNDFARIVYEVKWTNFVLQLPVNSNRSSPQSTTKSTRPAYTTAEADLTTTNIAAATSQPVSAFALLAKQRASPDGKLIVSYFDLPFVDSALNFYETSLLRHNITNFIFAASDPRCCTELNSLDTNCCLVYRTDDSSGSASEWNSPAFVRKMNIRTDLILEGLGVGLHVLHSDIDIYYMKNPFEHMGCNDDCDIATLVDDTVLNAGFVYVRSTQRGKEVYTRMREMSIAEPAVNDQDQMNRIIGQLVGQGLRHIRLPTDKFLCGKYYFQDGRRTFVGDNPCPECVVIHNNFIVSMEAKEYRAKETGLWDYDGGEYFSSLTRKYLAFDNPYIFADGAHEMEVASLTSALAIATVLNRTLILPAFRCNKNLCSFISYFRMSRFVAQFANVPSFRERSFLHHRKVPDSIRNSRSKLAFIATKQSLALAKSHEQFRALPASVAIFRPADKEKGATDCEIRTWFANEPASILQFHSLYGGAFQRFENDTDQKTFNDRLAAGLQGCNYMQL
jgi:hypothetical protein